MSALVQQTTSERQAIAHTRARLRADVSSGALTIDTAAEQLGLVRDGVRTLMSRSWTFEEAYRVSAALGYDFASVLTS